jgi:hypothetical protein
MAHRRPPQHTCARIPPPATSTPPPHTAPRTPLTAARTPHPAPRTPHPAHRTPPPVHRRPHTAARTPPPVQRTRRGPRILFAFRCPPIPTPAPTPSGRSPSTRSSYCGSATSPLEGGAAGHKPAGRNRDAGEWDGLLDWLRTRVLSDRRIDAQDLDALRIVEHPQEVCAIVDAARRRLREDKRTPVAD